LKTVGAIENLPFMGKIALMDGERLWLEVALEIERARQNINDIQAIEKAVWLTIKKSRDLRAEAVTISRPVLKKDKA